MIAQFSDILSNCRNDLMIKCYSLNPSFLPFMKSGQGAILTHGNLIANVAGTSLSVKFLSSDV